MAGDEVPQLYIHQELSSVTTYVRKLRGFDRIKLAAGEEKEVKMMLNKDSFYIYNQEMKRVTEPGWYQVLIGASSEDIKLNTRIKL